MHSSKIPIILIIFADYDYEKFQSTITTTTTTKTTTITTKKTSKHIVYIILNENWQNVEKCKRFQIWLLYFYYIKSASSFFQPSFGCCCLQTISTTTKSVDIQNVLLSSSSLLFSLSIQAICKVLKMKFNIAYVSNDIDTSHSSDSMSRLNISNSNDDTSNRIIIIRCNKIVLRNKCAPLNNNKQIMDCVHSGQINVETYLHSNQQSQLMYKTESACINYTKKIKTQTTFAQQFAQHMKRQLPLPPPTSTPNPTSQPIESSMSPLSKCSCDFVVTQYSSKQSVMNQTKITNNHNNNIINKMKNNINNKRDDDQLEKRIITENKIRERFVRQRVQSKTNFSSPTLLSNDLKKMFITFLLPLILIFKMLPMSCAGEYLIIQLIFFSRF